VNETGVEKSKGRVMSEVDRWEPEILGLDHVQLAIPPGEETAARQFYSGLLGLSEVARPDVLAGRGGVWFQGGTAQVHLGVEPDFRPARKAHPALVVCHLAGLVERLRAAGVPVTADVPLSGMERVHVSDPFGNRLELVERRLDPAERPVFSIAPGHELRIVTLDDAEELFALVHRNRAMLREWLPWLDQTQRVADTARVVQAGLMQFARGQGFHAGIRVDGKLAGIVGFHSIDWSHRATSIGYWLAAPYQRRGLMTESCRALIHHAFTQWNLNRIVIRCATANVRSRAIPERLGFVAEGTQRQAEWLYDHFVDLVQYALLRSEWQARQTEPSTGGAA